MDEKKIIKDFTGLITWQEGHRLVLEIYKLTRIFPKDEIYGLISQMRRAAISITSNISEGFSRRTSKDKIQFYYIALGSLTELQNELIIARDVGYIIEARKYKNILEQVKSVQQLINGMIRKLKILDT